MKAKISILAVLAILLAFHSLRADTLGDKVSVTGSIIQETSTNGTTKTLPITIKNVVSVLGIGGSTSELTYYYDYTVRSYVIALKGIMTSGTGTGTPIATIYTYSAEDFWNPNNHSIISGQTATGFDGNLSGIGLLNGVYPHSSETDTTKFTIFGTISGMKTIVKGTIVDIYKL